VAGADGAAGADASEQARPPGLSADMAGALKAPSVSPLRRFMDGLRADGLLRPLVLSGLIVLAALGVMAEAVLLRALLDLTGGLGLREQRLVLIGSATAFIALLLALDLVVMRWLLELGRVVEGRLRIAFLDKLPRLGDRYFHSRSTSDMSDRAHKAHLIRQLPQLGGAMIKSCAQLGFTVAGIAWLDPASALLAAGLSLAILALPLVLHGHLSERRMRLGTQTAALARFYFDALKGLVPIRTHGAEAAIRHEQENVLGEWVRAGIGYHRSLITLETLQGALGFGVAAWILIAHYGRMAEAGATLLLVYWTLRLPVLASDLGLIVRRYPMLRIHLARFVEPLDALEQNESSRRPAAPAQIAPGAGQDEAAPAPDQGVAIRVEDVTVHAGGNAILAGVSVEIAAGSHVAVVGASGSGKSSLVGLLMGFHVPTSGRVLVDGQPLHGAWLDALRARTAWVDPEIHLWNRSLLDNLAYGCERWQDRPMDWLIRQADLLEVLEGLEDGLQTRLGEGGALVSGGEGQRVRLGRALLRPDSRLVILDEAMRGLDRPGRERLLGRARAIWRDSTLLCITHDIDVTRGFDRVLVLDQGQIVEDGAPGDLAGRDGPYRALLDCEAEVRNDLWQSPAWRRWVMDSGRVREVSS
jgi:ABC-type multidrug transport system fused ATPase/permease subunit